MTQTRHCGRAATCLTPDPGRDPHPGSTGLSCLIADASSVLPDGKGGFTPCPTVLTAEEAVRYLRLDELGMEKGLQALRYYCGKGLLRGTQVGRWRRYLRLELDQFLLHQTDRSCDSLSRRPSRR
ncbi:MAG TPA: helix-turn-helix domain-containing protein [Phycisphaerae bacterium]|nr:helix-turn-helix domain-containing protein [Phycisphaerae bacterium]